MQGFTRRLFLASATLASGLVSRASLAGGSGLPPAATTADGSLIDALSRRRSTRLYSDQSIDAATLSTLLWFGINRPESAGHTASSWHTSMEADIYVADIGGVIQAAHVDAAIIPENVYLNCASVGLGTCLVGGADKAGLTQILKLPDSQMVTFSQPVGYLKQAA